MKKIFVSFALITLLLAACTGATSNNNTVSATPDQGANGPAISDPLPPNDGAEPPAGVPQNEPIINLPGAVRFQDQQSAPGQATWSEGNAFVNSADLTIMESYPIQVGLYLEGDLPTPCNHLTIDIAAPDAENNIHLRVYSLISPAETCIQVLEPFSENISLPTGDLADGTYNVFVNGTQVGTFTYPGG